MAERPNDDDLLIEAAGASPIRTTGSGVRWPTKRVSPPEATAAAAVPDLPVPATGINAQLSYEQVLELATTTRVLDVGITNPKPQLVNRKISVTELLSWLATQPGDSWQERWTHSGAESDPAWADTIITARNEVTGNSYARGVVTYGLAWVAALDVVRPSLRWMHQQHKMIRALPDTVLAVRDPDGRDRILDAIERDGPVNSRFPYYRAGVLSELARLLVHTGKQHVHEITPDELVTSAEAGRDVRVSVPAGAAYDAMSWAGMLPPGAAKTFMKTKRTRQLTAEELVDRTSITNHRMRNLFVDYLRARSASLDYASLAGLAGALLTNFWCELEQISPGIDTLTLTPETVAEWKERLSIIRHGTRSGQKRSSIHPILVTVRAFYYDINDWAQVDPARYAQFAAPNPITADDVRGHTKVQRQAAARSHARTRERLPVLPALQSWVERSMNWYRLALEASADREPGEIFLVEDVACEVAQSVPGHGFGVVHRGFKRSQDGRVLRRLDTHELFDVTDREDASFWLWAILNTLKETGLRIEEVEELTMMSLVEYRIPSTGQLLPLLQIAPSKTDQERVIVISPELATVLAAVIARTRIAVGSDLLPLIRRWDFQEKQESEPMPFLFQRLVNGQRRCISRAWSLRHLQRAVLEAGLVGEDGEPLWFQNHDFRRIFATDAVRSGLPIHIAAAILGHESLDTTQRYAAIYDEDVYQHHRAYIERRRQLRPSIEYRTPTSAEFEEFLGHFERRQMALGVCGRPFGTSCPHEFACIMCSMLDPDPEQEARLLAIISSLERQIIQANEHGWLGELEGLELHLAGANRKLDEMRRKPDDGKAWLGLPAIRPPDTRN